MAQTCGPTTSSIVDKRQRDINIDTSANIRAATHLSTECTTSAIVLSSANFEAWKHNCFKKPKNIKTGHSIKKGQRCRCSFTRVHHKMVRNNSKLCIYNRSLRTSFTKFALLPRFFGGD
eukprot:3090170-Amphidinium_carterae.1